MTKIAIVAGFVLLSTNLFGEVVYSSIPSPLPGNVTSLGYEATSTSEFGNAVNLAGSLRNLQTVDVIMSNWAKESDYETVGTSAGYFVPLTLTLYNYGAGGAVGSQITQLTENAFIAWRPESGGCTDTTAYLSGTNCYHGIASQVSFDFSSGSVVLPDTLILGLAYNTTDYGYAPTHVGPRPYDSLNFGAEGGPTVGSNVYADGAYLNSSWAGAYGSAGPTGTFRLDSSSWNGYSPQFDIVATTPEPGTWILMLAVMPVMWFMRRRSKSVKA